MLPGEAELVSERTGLSGKAKSVKRFGYCAIWAIPAETAGNGKDNV